MRPATLAEACRRYRAGEPWDKALGDFLQAFYALETALARSAMLTEEPPPLGAERDALVGGIAEYLFKRWSPETAPPWIGDRHRYLGMPWHPGANGNPALIEYLSFASPSEFKSRNVMVDEQPLRRARMPER